MCDISLDDDGDALAVPVVGAGPSPLLPAELKEAVGTLEILLQLSEKGSAVPWPLCCRSQFHICGILFQGLSSSLSDFDDSVKRKGPATSGESAKLSPSLSKATLIPKSEANDIAAQRLSWSTGRQRVDREPEDGHDRVWQTAL